MKIDTNIPSTMAALENRTSKASASAVSTTGEAGREAVGASLDRASLGMLGATLEGSGDIRHERVAALRAAISGGTYEIDPAKIANSMLSEHFGRAFAR